MGDISIGVDIEDINRFKKVTESFLNKIFTTEELNYCLSKGNPAQYLAARFAGKEAVVKALSTFLDECPDYKQIEIIKEPTGAPKVKIVGKENLNLKISLSHCKDKAIAFVIVLKG